MAQVIVGAGFSVADSKSGSMNTHEVGNEINMSLTGDGSVTVSSMFLVNGEKTYENITVDSTGYSQVPPDDTTYMEFNVQNVTPGAQYFRMEVWGD